MLKKFKKLKHFFQADDLEPDLDFAPFSLVVNGQTLQVLRGSRDDLINLLALEEEVYDGYLPWDAVAFRSELKKSNSLYVLIYQSSSLVAFIGCRFKSREAHITNLAVTPTWQKQGLGSYLLRLMIEYARVNHAECVSLEVRADNLVAQRLYSQLGFKVTLVRENYYRDTQTDALNMVLALQDTTERTENFEG